MYGQTQSILKEWEKLEKTRPPVFQGSDRDWKKLSTIARRSFWKKFMEQSLNTSDQYSSLFKKKGRYWAFDFKALEFKKGKSTRSQEQKRLKEQLNNKELEKNELISVLQEINMHMKEGKFGNTTNNNTTNNTTNNQFNLNIFLKETCKDAMNIQDFVDQIKLQLSDLETQGSKGYVEGISNIFIKNLDEMDEDKRPIHCTDTKRETLYVKNEGTWEKGETGREQMKKAIDTISKNNLKQFGQWINENPQCKVPHTPKADQFHQISSEVAGSAKEKNVDKIIRKIAKGTIIDKNNA